LFLEIFLYPFRCLNGVVDLICMTCVTCTLNIDCIYCLLSGWLIFISHVLVPPFLICLKVLQIVLQELDLCIIFKMLVKYSLRRWCFHKCWFCWVSYVWALCGQILLPMCYQQNCLLANYVNWELKIEML